MPVFFLSRFSLLHRLPITETSFHKYGTAIEGNDTPNRRKRRPVDDSASLGQDPTLSVRKLAETLQLGIPSSRFLTHGVDGGGIHPDETMLHAL